MFQKQWGTRGILILAAALLSSLLLLSCSGGPHPALVKARDAYNQASGRTDVQSYAPVQIREAGKALKQAEDADEDEDIAHYSKMTASKVQYAVAIAEKKAADKKRAELEQEKQKVLLDTRQKEIEAAQKELEAKAREAEKKAKEAEVARKQAEEARLKTEQARKEAEAKKQEAEAARKLAEDAQRKAEKLEKELADLKAQKTDRGLVLTLGDVLFATGKSELMAGAARNIDQLSTFLKENPKRNMIIEGHTDNVGKDSFNLRLSQRRADAVKTALLMRGVSGNRMITKGYGESYPVASNATDAGRQQNRRVEIIILDEGVSVGSMLRQ